MQRAPIRRWETICGRVFSFQLLYTPLRGAGRVWSCFKLSHKGPPALTFPRGSVGCCGAGEGGCLASSRGSGGSPGRHEGQAQYSHLVPPGKGKLCFNRSFCSLGLRLSSSQQNKLSPLVEFKHDEPLSKQEFLLLLHKCSFGCV